MKKQLKLAAAAAAIVAGLASGEAMAESTYGYDASATPGAVSARARIRINVNTPKLIILRVGSASATQDALDFNLTPFISTGPAPVTVAGNNQAADWDGSAPSFAASPVGALTAYLWHNNAGGAALTCSATTPFTSLAATDILVSSGAGLAHPGTDTACGTPVSGLARNTVHQGTWTYSVAASAINSTAAGSDFEIVTYTATAP
ncbi:hypothetical protein H8N03_19380 [Ramlibacter sp. USB13]|uniref:Uncharacterized protein n=1 Tax=Ramlibacter cellulosilyticus TaxID=2764187 RepID=A0A923MUS9_9BURK|nr:hypothetical protein [Ramlibacter cellulosilyticus]MBC5785118.1 hypothetical protein [Ramlibacter cellulosilyticus]